MTQRWGWAVGALTCAALVLVTGTAAAEYHWPWAVPVVLDLAFFGCAMRWILGLGSAGD